MQNNRFRALILIACALPLGACNSLLGIHFARASHKAERLAKIEPPAPAGTANTETGRRQLDDGQIGLAIESFRKALGAGEPVAPAANGLGVAFAQLGRYELALTYFQEAAAADPADGRYAENIARLNRSAALQMRHDADLAALTLKAEKAAAPPDTALAAAEPAPAGRLQRVSRGEVRIVSATPQAAPARSAGVQVDRRFKPLVRVSLAEPTASAAAAPQAFVRIALPEVRPADSPAQGARR